MPNSRVQNGLLLKQPATRAWITNAPPQSAATATYVAALWIMKASTDGSLEGRR